MISREERENFASSGADDRHYVIDKNEGILQFSDGICGKIPDDTGDGAIRIEYRCGGGKQGNVPAGDYDAVIIGHSQFEKIPLSAERQERQLRVETSALAVGILIVSICVKAYMFFYNRSVGTKIQSETMKATRSSQ